MKTTKSLFNEITEYSNLELAYYKAGRRKHTTASFLHFRKNKDINITDIQKRLITGKYGLGNYKQFTIYEPKERIITAAPFGDRVIHHAIINVMEEVFERNLIFHTYACRKGKGTHVAIKALQKNIKENKYFLKLDVRKYFDSINHRLLKQLMTKLTGDKKCLNLLYAIIDSYCLNKDEETEKWRGLPIGNLTSQFFANFYLSGLDHFVLENLKPKFYCRYMDDIIILSDSEKQLKFIYNEMKEYIKTFLNLEFKTPVFGLTERGIPFLGKRVLKEVTVLLVEKRKLKKRKIKKIDYLVRKGKISEEKGSERIRAIMVDM